MDYFELTRIISNIFIAFLVISFIGVFLTFIVSSFQLLFNRSDKVKFVSFKRKLMWSFISLVIIVLLFMGIRLVGSYFGVYTVNLPLRTNIN